MKIQNIIKALIIQDRKLLVIKNLDEVYLLPETVQGYQETMTKSIENDCIEKYGILVDVEDIAYIKEEIDNDLNSLSHRVEYYFICTIMDEINREENQKDVEWIEIDKIMDYHICPINIRQFIFNLFNTKEQIVYLGKVED